MTEENNGISNCKCCIDPVRAKFNSFSKTLEKVKGWPWTTKNNQLIDKNNIVVLDTNERMMEFLNAHLRFEQELSKVIEELVNELHHEKQRVKFYEIEYKKLKQGIDNMSDILKS